MSVVGAPQPWPPPPSTLTAINCLPGICTPNCRQYCNYFYLQPPPLPQQQQFLPSDNENDNDSKSISPLMAALIAVLAAAFLLLFYYTVISRFCRNRRNNRRNTRRRVIRSTSQRVDPMVHDPSRPETGLDQSYIRQITVFKYKKGDGLVEGTECAVCLAEFIEDESLRLMPNCEHAFHIPCIDTWLSNNSNCPLCRSSMNPMPARSSEVAGVNVSVAASVVDRIDDHVVVVREVERRGEVVVVVVAEEEKEIH